MNKILFLFLFIYLIFCDDSLNSNTIRKRRKYRRKPKYVSEENLFSTLTPAKSYNNNVDRIVTEIADISDPCYRKFAHTTIYNSQPFERKSDISLKECKEKCRNNIKYSLKKRLNKSYKCQSFVFSEGICDLYSHLGDDVPSILVRLNNSHYFEPSITEVCIEGNKKIESVKVELKQTPKKNYISNSIEDQIIESSFHPTFFGNSNDIRRKESSIMKNSTIIQSISSSKYISMDVKKKNFQKTCEKQNKVERYLKVSGFELFNNNQIILKDTNYEECSNICNYNEINNKPFKCKSFDLINTTCYLSSETAVPLGNGQLKKNLTSDYYEKICVEKNFIDDCPNIFQRYPQKILVGFAEMVLDVSTFEECFNSCLKAQRIFGFHCQSGMYYFEEKNLNCILNTETKNTQTLLFTDELHEIVDYFETSCTNNKEIKDTKKGKEFTNKELSTKEKIQPKRDMDEGTLLIPSPSKEINKEFLRNINPKWTVVQ